MRSVQWMRRSAALVAFSLTVAVAGAALPWSRVAAAQRDDASPSEVEDRRAGESDDAESSEPESRQRGSGGRSRGWPFLGVPNWQLADGRDVRNAFRDVVADATPSIVCIHCDGKHAILGSVVGSEGWVLTKASVLSGELTVHNAAGDEFPAELVARDKHYDLALLKADVHGSMPALQLEDVEVPRVGAWLATVGKNSKPVAVGVMSVPPREIPHQPGVLGVRLGESDRPDGTAPPVVEQVLPDTAAEEAGIQINDLILRINEQPVATRAQLIATVRTFSPGDVVSIGVRRDDEDLEIFARLGSNFPGDGSDRDEMQNMMGGRLSDRRFGFPAAFQHDTVLRPIDCGGPLVNLDGKVVGFNVARAGRTESYAIDVKTVRNLLKQWMNSEATQLVNTGVDAPEEVRREAPVGVRPSQSQQPAQEQMLVPAR